MRGSIDVDKVLVLVIGGVITFAFMTDTIPVYLNSFYNVTFDGTVPQYITTLWKFIPLGLILALFYVYYRAVKQ